MNATQMIYTFATDSITTTIDASSDDEAARKFADSARIKGVRGMAGLLGRIAERGGYAHVTDGRGDVVARIDSNTGTIQLYPQG